MGLARARSTNEYNIVGVINEGASMQLPDQGFIDLAGGKGRAL